MKKVILILGIVLFSLCSFSQNKDYNYKEILEAMQHTTPNVLETKDSLTLKFLENNWTVKRGDIIQIFLPASGRADYLFVKKKKGFLSKKVIGQVAGIVETSAIAVGLGSRNHEVIFGALEVANKAGAVSYGVEALDRIDELGISKDAEKIAGQKAEVLGWSIDDDEYIVDVKIGKKKYEINYVPAILLNEIKLIDKTRETQIENQDE